MSTEISGSSFYDMRFDGIQTLRGIAAVLVVLEHVRFFGRGAFGVDIFFCISGFMIMLTTQKNTRFFFRKRLLRIVPFYYLMTIGTYFMLLLFPGLFEQTQATPVNLVKSLLFIPFDMGGGVLQPLLRIGWTVNCEMFFYLLFGISLHLNHRYRGLICTGMLCALTAAGLLFPSKWAPFKFYSSPVMLEFALGILLFYAARGIYGLYSAQKLPSRLWIPCLLVSLCLFACLIWSKPWINLLGIRRLFYWGLPCGFIVLAFFLAGLQACMPIFSVMLGNISFSIYLVHYYPILFIDRKICSFASLNAVSAAGAAASLVLVLLLSWAAWYVIEKRFTGWLNRKIIHAASASERR